MRVVSKIEIKKVRVKVIYKLITSRIRTIFLTKLRPTFQFFHLITSTLLLLYMLAFLKIKLDKFDIAYVIYMYAGIF